MAKRKTEFELIIANSAGQVSPMSLQIKKSKKEDRPYLLVRNPDARDAYLSGDDLETFALNILKALKSKHLKP